MSKASQNCNIMEVFFFLKKKPNLLLSHSCGESRYFFSSQNWESLNARIPRWHTFVNGRSSCLIARLDFLDYIITWFGTFVWHTFGCFYSVLTHLYCFIILCTLVVKIRRKFHYMHATVTNICKWRSSSLFAFLGFVGCVITWFGTFFWKWL